MILNTNDLFIGGHPILDFINTVEDPFKSRDISRINDWTSFLEWAHCSAIFNEVQCIALKERGEMDTTHLLEQIHKMRESQYAMFSSLISDQGSHVMSKTVETGIKRAIQDATLERNETGYQWQIRMDTANWIIGTFWLSMEHFIRTQNIKKLRECGRCTWLFLDTGRGRGRRWCKMSTCGNREKSQYFRQRQSTI